MSSQGETADLLKSIPLFAKLGKRDRNLLAGDTRLLRLEAYTKLLSQGDEGVSCFLVIDGKAEVVRNSTRVAELGPGAVFGELSLIDGGERTADVTLLTRGEILEVQRVGFERLMESSPAATRQVMAQLCARVRDLDSAVYG